VATEADSVDVTCTSPTCADATGARYHRSCLLAHFDNMGGLRAGKKGAAKTRSIERMKLTGTAVCGATMRAV
jgi:hypothetical protein